MSNWQFINSNIDVTYDYEKDALTLDSSQNINYILSNAYLRALMHADGNIQYANYQSEEQMSDYLISSGYESFISDIIY